MSTLREDSEKDVLEEVQFDVRKGYKMDSKNVAFSKYYKYLGHSKKQDSMAWQCSTCNQKIAVALTTYNNAYRHYTKSHGVDLKQKTPALATRTNPFERDIGEMARTARKQEAFDETILKLLAEEGVPFSLVERKNFQALVKVLYPKIEVKSRRTYVRNLADQVETKVAYLLIIVNVRLIKCVKLFLTQNSSCRLFPKSKKTTNVIILIE